MTNLLAEPTEKTIELFPAASENAIRQGVDTGALLHLKQGQRRTQAGVYARMIALEGVTLSVEVDLDEEGRRRLLAAEMLKAAFTLNGRRYAFYTCCVEPSVTAQRGTITLSAPSTVTLLLRRQSRRYKLRSPGNVSVWLDASEADPVVALILDLSREGIACRLPAEATLNASVGQAVHLRFVSLDPIRGTDLTGKVTHVTPAGTAGHVVLGVEFLPDANLPAAQELITAALEECKTGRETTP
jgi:hypothetical protein